MPTKPSPRSASSANQTKAKTAAPPKPQPIPTGKKQSKERSTGPALFALIIGSDFYFPNQLLEGSYGSLQGCVRDAERVEQFLRARGGLTDARLVKLTSTPGGAKGPKEQAARRPTYDNIINGFRTVTSRAKKGDHVYIHYSGHGGRCPTLIPKVKGATGLDEALVPIDIGDSSARYVRDIEIAALLKEMTDKGLKVTAMFDSCHSGGATRGRLRAGSAPAAGPVAVRGVAFVDATKRQTESLVGTPAELAAAASPATRSAGVRGLAATAAADGTVVLAACRPSELAHEFAFDGKNRQGAVTYWFLSAAGQAPAHLTFRTVFDLVQARVHDQFPSQTPMLFGDPDLPILGGVKIPAAAAVPVTEVGADGKKVTLRTGHAGLTRAGAEFVIYPAGAPEPATIADRVAAVRVTGVGATEATAEVTKTFARFPRVGDRAQPAGVGHALVRTVRFERPDGSPPQPTDAALVRAEQALGGQSWVELAAGPDSAADFVVSTTENAMAYLIADAGGTPLLVRPDLPTADPESPAALIRRLVHLARFRAVQSLDNPDPLSPLQGKLAVELWKGPKDYAPGKPLGALKPFPDGREARVKPNEWVILAVNNRSSDVLNAVVLDLAPDWSIAVAHPDEPFHPIDPGDVWHLPLRASLPDGATTGRDVVKVIATIDPPPAYEMLTLPRLDQPPSRSARAAVTRSAGSPLDELFDAVAAERPPTRQVSAGTTPTRGWAVAHVSIEVSTR